MSSTGNMSNLVKGILLCAFMATAAFLYFTYNPLEYAWFPKCAFYQLTGLECPGCGSQRAIHAILNGNILEGLRTNPFIIISIPYGFLLIMILIFKTPFTEKLRTKLLNYKVLYIYCTIFIGWWIIRNLI